MAERIRSENVGLTVTGVVAGYGSGIVLDDLSLAVGVGEAVALLGRNGAGKTTLLRTIMGLMRPRAGEIQFAGRKLNGCEPFEIARCGIGYVPQGREIFAGLTVDENLLLGNLKSPNADEIYAYFPALAERRRTIGGRLSGGQQQQLAIGRALMGRPRLMLLDEPSDGIQPSVVSEIMLILKRIVDEGGMSLILVEQNINIASCLAHRIDFIDQGRVVASTPASSLRADPSLAEQYMAL
jgi:ABC-type branched-subunit amino acid transport system ATPase component